MLADLRHRLTHAVTAFDRRSQQRRRRVNIYALGHALKAVDLVIEAVQAGSTPREAVIRNLNDRLRDAVLRALDQPATTPDELVAAERAEILDVLRP